MNQRNTAGPSEHGEFRKIAFSVVLFPNPFAEFNIVSGLLESLKFIHAKGHQKMKTPQRLFPGTFAVFVVLALGLKPARATIQAAALVNNARIEVSVIAIKQ